jgi:hypothetical protein
MTKIFKAPLIVAVVILKTYFTNSCFSNSDYTTRIFRIGNPIVDNGDLIKSEMLKAWFSTRGIEFPAGSEIKYGNDGRHIFSINTPETHMLIEVILDMEKRQQRAVAKYIVFLELCGSKNSKDVAKMIAEDGWFSWTPTYGIAGDYLKNVESDELRRQFEDSLSNLLKYITYEISISDEIK